MEKELKIIGRVEYVDFPSLGLFRIPAKVDTGAYTSSIHCSYIEKLEEDGQDVLKFQLFDLENESTEPKTICVTDFDSSMVKSSSGHAEERYVVKTLIELFDTTHIIEMSLSDRGEMKYPVLLGRKLLRSNYVVDVAKKNLSMKSKKSPVK